MAHISTDVNLQHKCLPSHGAQAGVKRPGPFTDVLPTKVTVCTASGSMTGVKLPVKCSQTTSEVAQSSVFPSNQSSVGIAKESPQKIQFVSGQQLSISSPNKLILTPSSHGASISAIKASTSGATHQYRVIRASTGQIVSSSASQIHSPQVGSASSKVLPSTPASRPATHLKPIAPAIPQTMVSQIRLLPIQTQPGYMVQSTGGQRLAVLQSDARQRSVIFPSDTSFQVRSAQAGMPQTIINFGQADNAGMIVNAGSMSSLSSANSTLSSSALATRTAAELPVQPRNILPGPTQQHRILLPAQRSQLAVRAADGTAGTLAGRPAYVLRQTSALGTAGGPGRVYTTGGSALEMPGKLKNTVALCAVNQPRTYDRELQQLERQKLEHRRTMRLFNSVEQRWQNTYSMDTDPLYSKRRKRCNCTKSLCLKLYCDCFASGQLCSGCNCENCYNKEGYERERKRAMKAIIERNPQAFHPKISSFKGGENEIERRHQKGCHCRKSNCLKNYCECYEAKIFCSVVCKCEGCKNHERAGSLGSSRLLSLASAADLKYRQLEVLDTKLPTNSGFMKPRRALTDGEKLPFSFITGAVVEATCECMMAQAAEVEFRKKDPPSSGKRLSGGSAAPAFDCRGPASDGGGPGSSSGAAETSAAVSDLGNTGMTVSGVSGSVTDVASSVQAEERLVLAEFSRCLLHVIQAARKTKLASPLPFDSTPG